MATFHRQEVSQRRLPGLPQGPGAAPSQKSHWFPAPLCADSLTPGHAVSPSCTSFPLRVGGCGAAGRRVTSWLLCGPHKQEWKPTLRTCWTCNDLAGLGWQKLGVWVPELPMLFYPPGALGSRGDMGVGCCEVRGLWLQ